MALCWLPSPTCFYNLRELVTSTTVILAPGACGKGVRKRSRAPQCRNPEDPMDPMDPVENAGRLNPMHRHNTSGLFSGKGPPIFHDFPGGRPRGAQGDPKRPKGTKKSPRGAQGEPNGRGGKSKSAQTRHCERFTASYHARIDQ